MQKQTTSKLLMIEPTNFGFNEETFATNSFQNKPERGEEDQIQQAALAEFKFFVSKLRNLDVAVTVFLDLPNSTTPDSIFPNNWISTHQTGELILYPMATDNRRRERRPDIIDALKAEFGYRTIDLSHHELSSPPKFLEGTGSMIFDHANKIIYAAISPRTNSDLLNEIGKLLGYKVISFEALGKSGELIYHTNVMLCIGTTFAIIGENTISENDKVRILTQLEKDGKELISVTNEQVYNHFAGNMLQIKNRIGESILVLSETAYNSLSIEQLEKIHRHNHHILPVSIPTIEKIGGGSVRCMLTEIFEPVAKF